MTVHHNEGLRLPAINDSREHREYNLINYNLNGKKLRLLAIQRVELHTPFDHRESVSTHHRL
jgi:hypothetical protein